MTLRDPRAYDYWSSQLVLAMLDDQWSFEVVIYLVSTSG